jgi:hypothetical protein
MLPAILKSPLLHVETRIEGVGIKADPIGSILLVEIDEADDLEE